VVVLFVEVIYQRKIWSKPRVWWPWAFVGFGKWKLLFIYFNYKKNEIL